MIRHCLLTLALLALAAPIASAQVGLANWREANDELPVRKLARVPSPAERSYVSTVALSLGATREASLIEVPYGLEDITRSRRGPEVVRDFVSRGVMIQGEGVEIQRLRFQSPEHAQQFAVYGVSMSRTPTLVEVRGSQVVIARGERVGRPQDLLKIRAAAWDVLPHAPGAPSLAGVTLSPSTLAYETRVPSPRINDFLDGAMEEDRQRPQSGAELEANRTKQRWDGHVHEVSRVGGLRTLWVAAGEDAVETPTIQQLSEVVQAGSERLAKQELARQAEASQEAPSQAAPTNPQGSQSQPAADATQRTGMDAMIRRLRRTRSSRGP